MPYQAMATKPRMSAGTLAPKVPKAMRARTGYGSPVACPIQPERFMSMKATMMPKVSDKKTFPAPSPKPKSPAAKVYPPIELMSDIHMAKRE